MNAPFSRRAFLKASTLAAGAGLALPSWQSCLLAAEASATSGTVSPAIAPGPFQGTRESLKQYECPEWFRDAKFGIWAHWGPQSAPETGDWYARNMYLQGSRQYDYHVKTYGHPSKFGYKDVIPTWRAENFDPDYLLGLYRKAGAKYFVSMGVHHDNFDLWNSKHQPRWNAVATGPRKNIAQMFKDAALKQGLRFGVSQHLHASYEWMATCFGSDRSGPLAGVPYDGNDPQYADLYHEKHAPAAQAGDVSKVPESWKRQYLLRLQDLIDQLQPDLMYHDGVIRFEQYGLKIGGASVQSERGVARRQGGGGLHLQGHGGLPGGHRGARLRAGHRGGHLAQPLSDRHLHRQLALRPRRPIPDAQGVHRSAGQHRQPQRQLAAEFSLEIGRDAGCEGDGNSLRNHGLDGRQQRRHPRHPPLARLRRRPERATVPSGTPASSSSCRPFPTPRRGPRDRPVRATAATSR